MRNNYEPFVSVIIPTKNSAKTLGISLSSVKKQTYKNIECIVVNNYSDDNTVEIAREFGADVYNKGPERSAQRNFGAKVAKGEYIIFLDSDIELSPEVIQECVELAKAGFKLVTFPEVIVSEGFWGRCRALEALCYLGDDTIEAPRFYSKDLFNHLGGFDEELIGPEDWDLRDRAINNGYKIGRNKALTIHHEGRVQPLKRIKKKFYYAKTMSGYIRKHPTEGLRQIFLFRRCYWRNWKRLIKDPIHALGFMFLKSCETAAAALAILKGR